MLRRTKSSSLLPIVRLTNYFYPETADKTAASEFTNADTYAQGPTGNSRQGSLTPPPDYEQLFQAIQSHNFDGLREERVRKKYACQGRPPRNP